LGQIAAALTDGLRNLVSGLGGANDKAQGATFVMKMPTRQEIDACYRSTWLGRKIHDIPALDMTREWRGWQADDDQIEAIELVEKNLQVRARVRKALVYARLYGGSAIIMGLPGDPKTPAPEKIAKGALKYLHVMHRHQLHLDEQVRDLTDPLFGQPRMFRIGSINDGQGAEIHPSRVVTFKGADLPEGAVNNASEDWYWGDPLLVSVFDALTAHDTGVSAIANMMNEAKTDIVHVPGFMENLTSSEYERTLMERFSLAALLKSLTNTLVLDGGDGQEGSGEVWEQRQITWTGLPEVQRTLFQLVSGASDIPATRLIGVAPAGMNATGESDTRNYYDMLSSLQNSDLTPTMATLDEYLIMTATGTRDAAIFYDWNPLWQMTPKEKAERDKMVADTADKYATMGVVPDDAFAVAVQNRLIEDGVFPGLEAAIEEADKIARMMQEEPEPGTVDPNTGMAVPVPGATAPVAGLPAPANSNARPGAGGQPKNGGPGKATMTLSGNSKRRAANDRARRGVRDRATFGLMDSTALLLTDDMRLDFNPNHVKRGPHGGEFTGKGGVNVAFEVAPNPDDKEATDRWNALTDEQRAKITAELADEFVPQILDEVGVNGTVTEAMGGFEGHVNPSRLIDVTGRPFEVAGAIGDIFHQKAMVVMSGVPGPGLEEHGLISVEVPGATLADMRKLQAKIPMAKDGWTYHDGKMEMLNFTGRDNKDVATEIDRALGGDYKVNHGSIHTAYIESHEYVSPRKNRHGTAWHEISHHLRDAFAEKIAERVGEHIGENIGEIARGKKDRLADFNPHHRGPGPGGGQFTTAASNEAAVLAAHAEVLEKGKDGNEHLVFVAADGTVVGRSTGSENQVTVDEETGNLLDDPANQIDVVHNHPGEPVSLSPQDVSTLQAPGERSVTAVTADGSVFKASKSAMGDEGLEKLFGRPVAYDGGAKWQRASVHDAIEQTIHESLDPMADPLSTSPDRLVNQTDANAIFFHMSWQQADKLGLIKYEGKLGPRAQASFDRHAALVAKIQRELDKETTGPAPRWERMTRQVSDWGDY
jgi:phage-related protein (TIGR01555 family)